MPVQNYTGELMGTFPKLPSLHALQLINRAWGRVRDFRLWSWQFVVDAQLFTPNMLTAGTVSVTQFSTTITVNSAAATAINASASTALPIASTTLGIGRQIRIGQGTGVIANGGNVYNIVAWDNTSQLTIDRPFAEASVSNSPYRIYKCYYAPPATITGGLGTSDASFIRPISLRSVSGNYASRHRRLLYTQEELNAIDPSRSSTDSYAYIMAAYQPNALGLPVYELYPHPIQATVYNLTYYSRWADLSTTVDLPKVPYALATCVMDLARTFCSQWALSNVVTFPELQQTNWVAAQQMYKQDFLENLKACVRMDDEMMPQVPFLQGRRYDFPLSGSFLQNHDITGLLT